MTSWQLQKESAAKSEQREVNSEWRKSLEKRDWWEENQVARSEQKHLFYSEIQMRDRGAGNQGASWDLEALRSPRGSQGHNLI